MANQVQEPRWLSVVIHGCDYEIEIDANVPPDSSSRRRWRKRVYTGEPLQPWVYCSSIESVLKEASYDND